jgi:hypothetical protein
MLGINTVLISYFKLLTVRGNNLKRKETNRTNIEKILLKWQYFILNDVLNAWIFALAQKTEDKLHFHWLITFAKCNQIVLGIQMELITFEITFIF